MRVIVLGGIACFCLAILATSFTRSFFSSSATSSVTFSTTEDFPEDEDTSTAGSETIVINEFNPIGGSAEDWVELFNKTNESIDISGWSIHDNNSSDVILSGVVPANGYAVIVASGSAVTIPPSASRIELPSTAIGNGLAPAGDRVLLKSSGGIDIDEVSYGSVTTVFTLPPIINASILARNPNGNDANTATDWILQAPTLGQANN